MSKQNFQYVPFAVVLTPEEYYQYLQEGWYPANEDIWFQTRSTRIDLSLYSTSKETQKLAKKVKYFVDVNMTPTKRERLKVIYEKYIAYRDYRYDLSIDDIISNSHGHLYYVYQNEIVAFSFYRKIGEAHLGIEFAWDYSEPKLSLGHTNIHYNILFAKMNRCKYMYLSSGYESCSIYKSKYPGFEWWTGYSWSKDVEQYRQLCLRDDMVKIDAGDLA